MELKYMNMKVKYGNIIHADGTVLKRTITTYGTVEEFREAFRLHQNSGNITEANIKQRTIEVQEYVSMEEYFDVYDMSKEEEK